MTFLLAIAALIVSVLALRRTGTIASLEARIRRLEERLRSAGGFAEAGEGEAPPSRVSEMEGAAPRRLASRSEALQEDESPRDVPPPPPPPPAQREPRPSPLGQIDWERWLGVRGAAVLGGIVLALAGLFFFRYSIEHGLIPPWLRVVAGTMTGLACIAAAELRLRHRYASTADALAGAGVVLLYSSTWAACVLYELIGTPGAFVLMIAITAACCVLSWRHASLLTALLGLAGGFATPFMLSSGSDNPIGLFAYVLLLDVALLALAQQRGWPLLALLSLAVTTVYQAAWIFGRMGPARVGTGLIILVATSLVFALASRRAAAGGRLEWMATEAGGLLLPFAFAAYIAGGGLLAPSFTPLALLAGVLSAGACWLGAVHERPWLGRAAAAASLAVAAIWAIDGVDSGRAAWELALGAAALAAVFHIAVERDRERSGWEGPGPAAILAAAGFFAITIGAARSTPELPLWPWLTGWIALAGFLARHAQFPERPQLQVIGAAGLAFGLVSAARSVPPMTLWAYAMTLGVALQALALRRQAEPVRLWANHAAAAFAALILLGLPETAGAPISPAGVGVSAVFALFIALAAARLRVGQWLLAAVLICAYVHMKWLSRGAPSAPGTVFALEIGTVLLLSAFPFAVGRVFVADRFAWPAAAAAGPAWFIGLRELFVLSFGGDWIGLLPIGLGSVAALQGWRARDLWAPGEGARRHNLVWFYVAAIGFLTVAIPLQLEKEWITIGWSLEAVGVLVLWKRFDVVWLKYFALALATAVTVRLVANPAVLGYYARPSWRIVNWLFYTYLIPAAALLASAWVLRPLELERVREWEAPVYRWRQPLASIASAFAAAVVIFVWINLAIADWFSTGDTLRVSLDRMPARDLAMSISWAAYALVLLAAGVRLRSVGVRWVSLGLMIVTIAKVFLYDLGELSDLYRVASLLGLALSLIAVSLAYQRWVLGRAESAGE